NNELFTFLRTYGLTKNKIGEVIECEKLDDKELMNLEYLNISKKKLKEIPESIGNLENLEYFCFNPFNSVKFPDSFCNLKKLKKLILYGDGINSLPENIGNLENLEEIRLEECLNIKKFPPSMCNLKNLK